MSIDTLRQELRTYSEMGLTVAESDGIPLQRRIVKGRFTALRELRASA